MLLAEHTASLPLILETPFFFLLLTSLLPSEEGVPAPGTGLDSFFSIPSRLSKPRDPEKSLLVGYKRAVVFLGWGCTLLGAFPLKQSQPGPST